MDEAELGFDREALLGRLHIGSFIRFDRYLAFLGLATVIGANATFVRDRDVWWFVPVLLAFGAALSLALWYLAAGRLYRALWLVVSANVVLAATVTWLLPFLWPVMALNVVMGIALVAPYVGPRMLFASIAVGVAVAASFAITGGLREEHVAVELTAEVEWLFVIGGLIAQMIPITAIVWQNNRRQEAALTESFRLNQSLQQTQREVSESRQRVVRAADAERSRIERNLHDGAQQRLVALGVHLRLLESKTRDGIPADLHETVAMLVAELDGAVDDLRELAHGIYPPLLEARGLAEAFTAVARRTPSNVSVDADDVGRHDPSIEAALYFAGLEALTNAVKHATDAEITISLRHVEHGLVLTVADDGPGFVPESGASSQGLSNMSDRLAAVGGSVTIDSSAASGTTVVVEAPICA